jgi:succinate dehydrogenase/fumarate reductase flavoprotein subunit
VEEHPECFPPVTLFGNFGTFQSTHTWFAAAKHCHHIVQIVFNEFQHLLHLQVTKTESCTLLLVHVVNQAAMLTMLVGQDN